MKKAKSCSACKGTGMKGAKKCASCRGTGKVVNQSTKKEDTP